MIFNIVQVALCFKRFSIYIWQFRGESGNQWNGNSYGKQGYNGYQDPNVYGAAATGYGASTNGYENQ